MNYIIDQITQSITEKARQILGSADLHVQPANPKIGADFAIPCFKVAAEQKKTADEVSRTLIRHLKSNEIGRLEVAGGFVNIWLSDSEINKALKQLEALGGKFGSHETLKHQEIVIEHTDPNPFKEFHIGHAYSNTVGEALGRLYELAGARVHQVLYYGDVGVHIAKAVWGIQKLLNHGDPKWFVVGSLNWTMSDVLPDKRNEFLGHAYAYGATKFEEDDWAKTEMVEVNKRIYSRDDDALNRLYEVGKRWSLDYFDDIYDRLHTEFERRYPESQAGPEGIEIVNKHINKVFEYSEGAIVFKGDENEGLHTRVFVNGQGLPTYEAKELGLTFKKQRDYPHMVKSVVVTANEIDEYFKVLIAAIRKIDNKLASKMLHLSHGVVKLKDGKMSSRTGQVVKATDVIDQIEETIAATFKTEAQISDIALGALKYAFLKHRLGGDITFDINESISLEGNSGPYIQYAYARGRSILNKVTENKIKVEDLLEGERELAIKILSYPSISAKAIAELSPQNICSYLYELTQVFNRFYEKNRVVGDAREAVRAHLVKSYTQVLKNGLNTLNIPVVEKI